MDIGFQWQPHSSPAPALPPPDQPRELEEVVCGYGVRPSTVARIVELGFTSITLLTMTEAELDEMMAALAHLFRWDLLFGERFGLRAALRAERHRLSLLHQHRCHLVVGTGDHVFLDDGSHGARTTVVDASSQEVLSRATTEAAEGGRRMKKKGGGGGECRMSKKPSPAGKGRKKVSDEADEEEDEGSDQDDADGGSPAAARQREHPFVVTVPGEVARAKKNGLDYLFHLYEQCRIFLLQVQSLARVQGHKCPTKVTNQVFRYAHKVGAAHINKPKMRHYVHCYALHCLDQRASDDLRRAFKAAGENVGAWRQACYRPLVDIAACRGWDVDALFADHPKLAVWYVPNKLRQLCHAARSSTADPSAVVASSSAASLMF